MIIPKESNKTPTCAIKIFKTTVNRQIRLHSSPRPQKCKEIELEENTRDEKVAVGLCDTAVPRNDIQPCFDKPGVVNLSRGSSEKQLSDLGLAACDWDAHSSGTISRPRACPVGCELGVGLRLLPSGVRSRDEHAWNATWDHELRENLFSSHLPEQILVGPPLRTSAETLPEGEGRSRESDGMHRGPRGKGHGRDQQLRVHARTLKIQGIHVDGPNGRPRVLQSCAGLVFFLCSCRSPRGPSRAFTINLCVISHDEQNKRGWWLLLDIQRLTSS